MRALGVRVSLDDFGIGYCSLSYLQQFPVDTLKIDRGLRRRIGEQGEGDEIVRLIVRLAETLKLDVVAEGTESAQQVAHLAGARLPVRAGLLLLAGRGSDGDHGRGAGRDSAAHRPVIN